jgi:2-polyprenyl-3-methyl-5-hydroxy-6-metoxy-1,4-benzoquinol methylase
MPNADQLGRLYENYYTHSDKDPVAQKPGVRELIRAVYRFFLKFSPLAGSREELVYLDLKDRKPGKMLELGSGTGERLIGFRNLGWQVEGHDLDPVAADFAAQKTGVQMHVGPIDDLAFKNEFDLIVMFHVLEHVLDPEASLRHIHQMLKPGGTLAVCVPNGESYTFSEFGKHWLHLDPPRHTFIFRTSNVRAFAERAGFRVVHQRASTAHATNSIRGTLAIQQKGSHTLGTSLPLTQELKVFAKYFWLLLRSTERRGQGDDLILHLQK